jgi:hypothetical protein
MQSKAMASSSSSAQSKEVCELKIEPGSGGVTIDRYHKLHVHWNGACTIIHAAHKDDDEFVERVMAQIANFYSAEDITVSVMIQANIGLVWVDYIKSKLIAKFPALVVSHYTATHPSMIEEEKEHKKLAARVPSA